MNSYAPGVNTKVGFDYVSSSADCVDRRAGFLPGAENTDMLVSRRLKAKDSQIFNELFCRHHDRLVAYLVRLTSDRELAADLSQDVWTRVLINGSQFEGKSQFSTWLYAIARNRVCDLRRRHSATQFIDSMDDPGAAGNPELRCNEKSPYERCADSEGVRLLTEVVQTLKPKDRELVELRYQSEMTLKEIAQRMGCSQSSVKARLHRAVGKLKRRMNDIFPMRVSRCRVTA